MTTSPTVTIALSLGAGVAIALIFQRLRQPALLALMLAGIVLGPEGVGIIDGAQLGGALSAFISLAVGILIYEGSLHLDRETIAQAPRAVRGLLTTGALVTWVLSGFFAWYFAGLPADLAAVLGAMLTVTGPTVVQPLLRRVHLTPKLHSALASEAILIDPIGVVATITTLELVLSQRASLTQQPLSTMALYLVPLAAGSAIGAGIGVLASWIFTRSMWRGRAGDEAVSIGALAGLALAVGLSEMVQRESGLVAAAVSGMIFARLGRRKLAVVRRSMETIAGVLVSVLFVLLASRINLRALTNISVGDVIFLVLLLVVVRPACIFIGTLGSRMSLREKLMASFVAPRGIVAVSLASIVATEIAHIAAVRLEQDPAYAGAAARLTAHAEHLESLTIIVVLVTVGLSSVLTGPIAALLKVKAGPPAGLLIVGAHALGREIGRVLQALKVPVVLVDSNPLHVKRAEDSGLRAFHGDATDPRWLEERVLNPQIGRIFAITDNADVDGVVSRWALDHFGPRTAMRWSTPNQEQVQTARADVAGIPVAAPELSLRDVLTRLAAGQMRVDVWSGEREGAVPIFTVREGRIRAVRSGDEKLSLDEATQVVGLAPGEPGSVLR